jgi:PAS domain-containing protein
MVNIRTRYGSLFCAHSSAGSLFLAGTREFAFTDRDGLPLVMEVGLDIGEAKRAEEALRRANAYNRSLLEASLDPLVTIGPDGKITDVNAATEAVTRCVRAALIGTDFSDYFTDPEKARAGYPQVFREGFVRDYPLELRHRDGPCSPTRPTLRLTLIYPPFSAMKPR